MVFTTPLFLFLFLPLALAWVYGAPVRLRNAALTLVSYVFYGWWSPWFVALMGVSTLIDFGCGRWIGAPNASERARRAGVTVSVTSNLVLLGFFKYFVFLQENWNRLLEVFGASSLPVLQVVLPVGISFYTFQSMSYSIDIYRGQARPARSLVDFACYVALFPQLVAGPIVRYHTLADQLDTRPQRGELFAEGALTFLCGFSKKILLANTMGVVAEACFDAGSLPVHVAWFGLSAYAFQLYFDFSGYSDMAIGLGAMLGFRIPENFRSPFRSASITEFWRRWHLSLSSWLRDYLYIPLGGNRRGVGRTYVNLLLVMVLAGLWHGAAWTFLIWGILHGGALGFERWWQKRRGEPRLWRPLRVARTFFVLQFGWVLFHEPTLAESFDHFRAMFVGLGSPGAGQVLAATVYTPFNLTVFGLCVALVWGGIETCALVPKALASLPVALGIAAVFLLAIVAMFAQAENPFIYFQF